MHRWTMAPLIAWGKWAVNWTAHDLSVRLSSHSSLCAPKAGGEAWEVPGGMASVLHAVPQSGPPPNLKHSVNGEILPVPSKKGRMVGKPHHTRHGGGCNAGPGTLAPYHWRIILGQLCLAWGQPRGIVVAWALGMQLPTTGLGSSTACQGAPFEAEKEAKEDLHATATPCLNQITRR